MSENEDVLIKVLKFVGTAILWLVFQRERESEWVSERVSEVLLSAFSQESNYTFWTLRSCRTMITALLFFNPSPLIMNHPQKTSPNGC